MEYTDHPTIIGYQSDGEGGVVSNLKCGWHCVTVDKSFHRKLIPHFNPDSGYLEFGLRHNQDHTSTMRVHRFICECHYGLAPFTGALAMHKDDHKLHNHPNNLKWGTPVENARQALAKLSIPLVLWIHHRISLGESRSSIARNLNISPSTVEQISKGNSWKDCFLFWNAEKGCVSDF